LKNKMNESKVRIALVGVGKMGLSHQAIVNMHPDATLAAICDASGYMLDVLNKYSGIKTYSDFKKLLAEEPLDAILIATPSKTHAWMVEAALDKGLHVFCEKPFVLDPAIGDKLVELAERKSLVTQVGYHYRFVGAFREAQRIVASGALGELHHISAEAYGPVVLKPKGGTWRTEKNEGGGCLYDYACHALDLVNFMVGTPTSVSGVVMNRIFSNDVEDEVYASLHFDGGLSGRLAANWSDESFRKMSTKVTVWGTKGRVTADRQECQIFLREKHAALPDTEAGWTVRYTTELTEEVWYYLRGEEYSAQIDHFIRAVKDKRLGGLNNFRSALATDKVAKMIADAHAGIVVAQPERALATAGERQSFWQRLFGG
jgi:predicted dehydrogenase